MKKIFLTLALLLPVSYAQADKKEMMICSQVNQEEFTKKMNSHQDKFLKKVKLTKDQEKQVRDIRNSAGPRIFAQVQKVRGSHSELMGVVEKDASKEDIRAQFLALEKEKQALMSEKFEQMLNIREILNPEQRQRAVAEMKEKMHDICD